MTRPMVGVVDYGMGNLRSVTRAIEAAGADVVLAGDPDRARSADALCVPGQGIFGRCMANLARGRFDIAIRTWIESNRPYLGICLGLQILFEASEERGSEREPVEGLGLLGGRVTRLDGGVPVPHMGWNTVSGSRWPGPTYFYFDHSFAAHPAADGDVVGWCEHGERFAAAVESGSAVAVQFHPEKSGTTGIDFLKGWVNSI
ncbi:MAG: imidazole glycerol phosphate synthase subunit HisH [Actinomycetota bacterium]|nr:imidazole glycerol phosphate synthase subunit HisH [Actinomycetota bacterium]